MTLPINIVDLIHGKTVEWERLEFKRGWNPEEIVHTISAFANDLHNWGGGYIVLGIEEKQGQAVLPPIGLEQSQIDKIQGKIIQLGKQISPNYFPIAQPYVLDDQFILIIWCPAGDNRAYIAPITQGKGAQKVSYIRLGSHSVIAKDESLRELQALAARIPFDDRLNHHAKLEDLDLGLIQAHLQEIKSDLYEQSKTMSFQDLCHAMQIYKGAKENLKPVNVGLLFFCKHPEDFFNRAWIEIVWHQDLIGNTFQERYFKGPLQKQLNDALSFLQSNIISEQVIKNPNQAQSERFYNFPFAAVEEALANAVYHKSYELGSPIEVQVWPDKIEILSFPGPVSPVDAIALKNQQRIVARDYRNRRIGDFLKELHLTEGRGTGVPRIYHAMAQNGSPPPILETDAEKSYFLTILLAHPLTQKVGLEIQDTSKTDGAANKKKSINYNNLDELLVFIKDATDGAKEIAKKLVNTKIHPKVKNILSLLLTSNSRATLFKQLGLSNNSENRAKYLDPLIQHGLITMSHPDTLTHPMQRYQTTYYGKRLLSLIQ